MRRLRAPTFFVPATYAQSANNLDVIPITREDGAALELVPRAGARV